MRIQLIFIGVGDKQSTKAIYSVESIKLLVGSNEFVITEAKLNQMDGVQVVCKSGRISIDKTTPRTVIVVPRGPK